MTEPSNRPPDDDEPFPDPVTPDGPAPHLHLAAPTEISGPAGLAFVDVTFSVPKFWSVFGSVPLTTDDRVPLEENPHRTATADHNPVASRRARICSTTKPFRAGE